MVYGKEMWQLRNFDLKNEAETVLTNNIIKRVLNKLLKEDKILKVTGGRYTKYIYNNK